MYLMSSLVETVKRHYGPLSAVWSDETANPKSRPLPMGKPPSYGQCEVSSAVLLDPLRHEHPEDSFSIVRGRVLVVSGKAGRAVLREVIDEHLWIHRASQPPNLTEATVVDVTADQAQHPLLSAIIVQTYDELTNRGIVYQPHIFHANVARLGDALQQYHSNFEERYELLREKFMS